MARLVTPDTLRAVLDLPAGSWDADLDEVIGAVEAALIPRLTPGDHTSHPNCREAALGMCVQVWTSRRAPGGQLVTADLGAAMSPHLLGPGLIARFGGLLGLCLQVGRRPVIA